MAYSHDTSVDCAAPLPVGLHIFGYTLLDVIGSGGFGITYKARRDEDGTLVVLKESLPRGCAYRAPGTLQVLPKPGMEGPEQGGFIWAKENFLREAQTLSGLHHPSIVKVLDAFETDETATTYYSMPLVSEHSLQDYILKSGVSDRKWVLYLLSSLLGALNYIHSLDSPLLHRDIKPENILITDEGRPVLIDFGSSREAGTDIKTRIITHSFSPIEQSRGTGEGAWTDIYSLGATMYYLITGTLVPPLDHRIPQEEDAYIPLSGNEALEKAFGTTLLSSIDKALAFRAEERFQSALEWASVLQNDPHFQSSLAVVPPHEPHNKRKAAVVAPLAPQPRQKSGSKLPMALLMLFLVMLLALLGAGGWLYYDGHWPFESKKEVEPLVLKPLPGPSGGNTLGGGEERDTSTPQPTANKVQLRVLAKPGTRLYSMDGLQEQEARIPILAIYYVDSSQGESFIANGTEFYRVCNRPGEAPSACMRKEDTLVWSTSLAMRLTHPGGHPDRQRDISLYFQEDQDAEAYAGLPQEIRDAVQTLARGYESAQSFEQKLREATKGRTLGIIGREPLKWLTGSSSHLLPIIGLRKDAEGMEPTVAYGGHAERKSKIYRVAAMGKPQADQAGLQGGQPSASTPALDGVDIVFVVDTTKSMAPFIEGVKKTIAAVVRSVGDSGTGDCVRFGIVGYRDSHFRNDGSGRVIVPTIEYVTKNFTPELLPARAFNQVLAQVQASRESTVGYTEDVCAGLYAAVRGDDTNSVPAWRENSLKFICLFGDAPGREPGEREDSRLCSDRNRPLGTLSGMSSGDVMNLLSKEHKISLATAFILTNQENARSKKAWEAYELAGVRQFRDFAYVTTGHDGQPRHHFTVINKMGQAVDPDSALARELSRSGTEGQLELTQTMSDDAIAEMFSQQVLAPIIEELSRYASNPEEALKVQETAGARLSATQCMFADAYVEFLAAHPQPQAEGADPVPVVAQSWMLEKDSRGREGLESCAILTRKQLEKFISLLQFMAEELGSKNSHMDNWDSVQKLMVITLADPNLVPPDVSKPEQIREFAGQFSQEDIAGMLNNFPDSTTSFINKLGSELTPQDKDALLNYLQSKLLLLLELSKNSSWVPDSAAGSNDLDFISIPLDYLP